VFFINKKSITIMELIGEKAKEIVNKIGFLYTATQSGMTYEQALEEYKKQKDSK